MRTAQLSLSGAKLFHPCFIFDKIGRGTAQRWWVVPSVVCLLLNRTTSYHMGQASLTPTLIGCSKKLTRIGANYRKVRIYAYRERLGESFKLVTQEI